MNPNLSQRLLVHSILFTEKELRTCILYITQLVSISLAEKCREILPCSCQETIRSIIDRKYPRNDVVISGVLFDPEVDLGITSLRKELRSNTKAHVRVDITVELLYSEVLTSRQSCGKRYCNLLEEFIRSPAERMAIRFVAAFLRLYTYKK